MIHQKLYAKCLLRTLRHAIAVRRPARGTVFVPGVHHPDATRRALLVHLVEPFRRDGVDTRHQNRFQASELARILATHDFRVDVLAPRGALPPGTKPYDVVVDLHPGLTAFPRHSSTLHVAYITGSNPAFANEAERVRLSDLARRRGRHLRARRQTPEFSDANLGRCSAMLFIGNEHNLGTYAGLRLPPVHFVTNFAYRTTPAAATTGRLSRHFLFLASGGQVHKGLDLLLEVFAQRPEWHLHVCSNFHEEWDFVRAYRRELFHLSNITPHGFLKLDSAEFVAVARRCGHVVLPSCSEATAGSVISAMAAGLRPVVSRECGFDEGLVDVLETCEPDAIESLLARCASRSPHELEAMSSRAIESAADRFSPEAFTRSVESALSSVLSSHPAVPSA
ncbi:hypothetical protein ASA1KI_46000 [Opitutales bacterium ASA1]|uniref:glycosyltransferase n=1 Tax=Congregicoccus parvus TaxID=3081749 RepID=UPI002B29AE83|nr:hypothetical protein ASA1KI_46000 [Opitutales bacterium ASA1]